uniref:Uncharacterized protein n=1 Tax=Zea mays TaxID=4577 RepID=A0A804M871_MAIZE
MDHAVLSSSGKVSSIQAEVDAPHGAGVGSQLLRHEQPGELLARLPVLAHPNPSRIARAGAIEAVISGRAEAPSLPLLLLLDLVPLVGAAAAVGDGARQLPDATQPAASGLPPGLAGRGGGVPGGGRGGRGGGPLHELVHDRGAADAELELLEGEVAAGAHLPHHLHLPDLELRAVVQVPDPALLLPAAGAGVPRQRGPPERTAGSGLLRGRRRRGRGRRGRRWRAARRRRRRRRVGGEAEAVEQVAAALLDGRGLGDPDVVRGGWRVVVAPAAAAAVVVGVVVGGGGGGGGAGGGEDPIQRLVELLLLLHLPLGRRIQQAPRRLRHCRPSGTGSHLLAPPGGRILYARCLVSCRCYSFCLCLLLMRLRCVRGARRHSPSVRSSAVRLVEGKGKGEREPGAGADTY